MAGICDENPAWRARPVEALRGPNWRPARSSRLAPLVFLARKRTRPAEDSLDGAPDSDWEVAISSLTTPVSPIDLFRA